MLGGRTWETELRRSLEEARDIAVEARTEGRTHQANCIEHNRRVEDMLRDNIATRNAQHKENQDAINQVKNWMVTLVITGLGSAVAGLVGAVWFFVIHEGKI